VDLPGISVHSEKDNVHVGVGSGAPKV
jgi:hypothetical protein